MNNFVHIYGALRAISVVSNCCEQSVRFCTDGLGYQLIEDGFLSDLQRKHFGRHLGKYVLLGHDAGAVVRLFHSSNAQALPNRAGAQPWDNGLAVMECGTPNVQQAYQRLLSQRFGAVVAPLEFDCEGPEPLGYVVMKSTAFVAPAGELIFVTQIVRRQGGVSLLQEAAVAGINTPANAVLSLQSRSQQAWYREMLGIYPVNDLILKQPDAAAIMAGPPDMGFDMCLMGTGTERIGMEQHVYEPHNPSFSYRTYPCDFTKTGIASACWQGVELTLLKCKLIASGQEIISEVGLPIRGQSEPNVLVFRGVVGEVLELLA